MKNKNEMGRIANKVQFHISLALLLHLGDHDHSLIWFYVIAWDGMSDHDCLDEALFPAIAAATKS